MVPVFQLNVALAPRLTTADIDENVVDLDKNATRQP
jgi:hypothetical protein